MIAHLTGKIIAKNIPSQLTLDVNGIGYAVEVPANIFTEINDQQTASFWIYTHVREDALRLFGFKSIEERTLFLKMLSVSGVGPRIALSICSFAPNVLRGAIDGEDIDFFKSISGIGPKLAKKIIFELRGVLPPADENGKTSSEQKDAIDALIGLGFSNNEAREATRDKKGTAEEIVRAALAKK